MAMCSAGGLQKTDKARRGRKAVAVGGRAAKPKSRGNRGTDNTASIQRVGFSLGLIRLFYFGLGLTFGFRAWCSFEGIFRAKDKSYVQVSLSALRLSNVLILG